MEQEAEWYWSETRKMREIVLLEIEKLQERYMPRVCHNDSESSNSENIPSNATKCTKISTTDPLNSYDQDDSDQ